MVRDNKKVLQVTSGVARGLVLRPLTNNSKSCYDMSTELPVAWRSLRKQTDEASQLLCRTTRGDKYPQYSTRLMSAELGDDVFIYEQLFPLNERGAPSNCTSY